MRLSRKDEHSIIALLLLANHDRQTAPVNLAELAESLGISTSYLEHLFSGLRKHGLVEGLRGVGGGYRLARPASQITIADILYATQALAHEESVDTANARSIETNEAWQALSKRIRDFLGELTLADFIHTKPVKLIKQREESVSNYIATMFLPPSAYSMNLNG